MPYDLFPQVEREAMARASGNLGIGEPSAFAGFWRSVANSVPAAALETGSAISGLLTEYGRAAAFAQGAPAAESINQMGAPDPVGQEMRRQAKTFTPNPMESGMASQIVFGAGKVLTKAIAAGALGGVPGAIAGTGVLEGATETQKLQDEGVDFGTAAAVGVVRGVTTAASIALPIAGATALKTIGLVVAGGPASFMAEQTASRAILDAADYKKIAEQYDPLDPVGLAVSTILPAVVGGAAHGVRAIKGAAKAAVEADAAKFHPTPEQEAAARVVQLNEHIEATNLSGFDNAAGVTAHVDALNTAKRQMDAGRPVEVGAIVRPEQFGEPARLAMNRVAAAINELSPTLPEKDVHARALEMVRSEFEPDLIAVAGQTESKIADVRVQVQTLDAQLKDLSDNQAATIKDTARELQDRGVKFKEATKQATTMLEARSSDLEASRERLGGELTRAKEAEVARQELDQLASGKVPERLQPAHDARANEVRRAFDERPIATSVRAAMADTAARAPEPRAGEAAAPAETAHEVTGSVRGETAPNQSPEPGSPASASPGEGKPAKPVDPIVDTANRAPDQAAGPAKAEDAHELAAKQLAEADPSLKVMDESGAVRPISEVLADASRTFEQEVKDAGAFVAGVNCFLRH